MKHRITRKQWDELDENEKFNLGYFFWRDTIPKEQVSMWTALDIGMMIEFLGHGWMKDIDDDDWKDYRNGHMELCDALWEAVKYKLKNETYS